MVNLVKPFFLNPLVFSSLYLCLDSCCLRHPKWTHCFKLGTGTGLHSQPLCSQMHPIVLRKQVINDTSTTQEAKGNVPGYLGGHRSITVSQILPAPGQAYTLGSLHFACKSSLSSKNQRGCVLPTGQVANYQLGTRDLLNHPSSRLSSLGSHSAYCMHPRKPPGSHYTSHPAPGLLGFAHSTLCPSVLSSFLFNRSNNSSVCSLDSAMAALQRPPPPTL